MVVCGLAIAASRFIRERMIRSRAAAAIESNQVSTVSQVLHLAIQGAPTGVTVIDRGGEVILSNQSAHEMALVRDRTINPEIHRVANAVFEDKETRSLDTSIAKRRTGNRVSHVQAVIKPLTLVDDRFVIVYGTDQSENVRMESARRDFVANVSHEMKTPVGGIALLAEALLDSPEDPEHVNYFGTRLQREAIRMADMVNELISLSKLQGAEALPDMEPVPVDDIIAEAVTRNKVAADTHDVELNVSAPSNVLVRADKALLVTAVSNLIANAINYSPQSMPVSISQKVVGAEVVLIRVTDRGIGIAPEDQERVFERFFRVDKARSRQTGGTGLGLAIVKHVVANHGGNIKLWSRPGTGSTFTIELPVYHEEESTVSGALDPNLESHSEKTVGPGLRNAVNRVAARRKDKA